MYTLALEDSLYRYFEANVCTVWAHEPLNPINPYRTLVDHLKGTLEGTPKALKEPLGAVTWSSSPLELSRRQLVGLRPRFWRSWHGVKQTNTDTKIQASIQIHIVTFTYIHMHYNACMHACMRACIQTHIHTCIHTYLHYVHYITFITLPCIAVHCITYGHTYTYIRTCMHAGMQACTYIHRGHTDVGINISMIVKK